MNGRRLAPGPRGRLVAGSYFDFQRDPLGFLVRANREYGHIFRFRGFWSRGWHLVTHPEYVDHILNRRFTNYPKREFAKLISLVAGNGLLALEDQAWARQRRLMQPAFHRDRLAQFARIMQSESVRLLDAWHREPGRPRRVEALADFSRLAMAIVGRALFSIDVSAESDAFRQAYTATLAYLNYRLVHPFAMPLEVPTPRNRAYLRAVGAQNAMLDRMVAERRRSGAGSDLLGLLMAVRDEDGRQMSDLQIREECKTLLTAGHETTAATLFWCFYLLAHHPEQERRLHAEVDALSGPPTLEDLARLPFTRMIIDEAMRLYPSVVWQARTAAGDDEIGGFAIPAGSRVMFSPYITHRHPDFWPNPERFDPDRFDPRCTPERPRGAYLPFGLGPRQCIGSNFALMEAQIVLASVAQRYSLRMESTKPIEPELLATLRPRPGVLMRLEPRNERSDMEP